MWYLFGYRARERESIHNRFVVRRHDTSRSSNVHQRYQMSIRKRIDSIVSVYECESVPGKHEMSQSFAPVVCTHSKPTSRCPGTQLFENTIDQFERQIHKRWNDVTRHLFRVMSLLKMFHFISNRVGILQIVLRRGKNQFSASLRIDCRCESHRWHLNDAMQDCSNEYYHSLSSLSLFRRPTVDQTPLWRFPPVEGILQNIVPVTTQERFKRGKRSLPQCTDTSVSIWQRNLRDHSIDSSPMSSCSIFIRCSF